MSQTIAEPTRQQIDALRGEPDPVLLKTRLSEIFDTQLTTAQKAAFYELRTAVNLALKNGDVDVAKTMIQNVEAPPELQSVMAQILAEFDQ
jgi:hypothetical protein